MNFNIFSLFNFCDWWWLAWLLPFLLGLLIGWLLWGRFKALLADANDEIAKLKVRISELEDLLAKCKSARADLEGEIALLKGLLREKELALKAALECDGDVAVTPIAVTPRRNKYDKLKEDNLQVIEGIGPKMNEVLIENGITSWSVLAGKNHGDLKAILDKYGDKYRIIDPSDWPAQAALAARGDWDGLIAHQTADGSESKAENLMIKMGIIKKWTLDDLKAVEGIGPKIEGLLNDAGINTWRELANTAVDKIQSILDAAGDRFNLADPMTWPHQAGFAADGKWDELDDLQEKLLGGRV